MCSRRIKLIKGKIFFLVFCSLIILNCNPIEKKSIAPLLINLTVSDSLFNNSSLVSLDLEIINPTTYTFILPPPNILESPIFSLIIWNKKGERVPTIPPSLPPIEPLDSIILAPQKSYQTQYSLNIFSPNLPDGYYSVSMQNFKSDTISFKIQSTTKN